LTVTDSSQPGVATGAHWGVKAGVKARLVNMSLPVGYSRQVDTVYTSSVVNANGSVVLVAIVSVVWAVPLVSIDWISQVVPPVTNMLPWMLCPLAVWTRVL